MKVKRISKKTTAETLYRGHQRIVNHLAWTFAKKFRRSFEEMKEAATDCLTEQVVVKWNSYYDPKRASPTTVIYQNIYFALLDYCTHKRWDDLDLGGITEEPHYETGWLDRFLQELGEEGRALTRVIVEAPEELSDLVQRRAPVRSKEAVCEYLRRRAAWDLELFERAWKQVAETLEVQ